MQSAVSNRPQRHCKPEIRSYLLLLVLWALPASLQAADFSIYIDSDLNPATGCSASISGTGPVSGAEVRIDFKTSPSAPYTVTPLQVADCQSGAFALPVAPPPVQPPIGPSGIGLNNGLDRSDVVEIAVALAAVNLTNDQVVNATVVGTPPGSAPDRLLSVTRLQGLNLATGQTGAKPPQSIPALPPVLLTLLAGLLLLVGLRYLPTHASLTLLLVFMSGWLVAQVLSPHFKADGDPRDWADRSPTAVNPAGSGPPLSEVRQLFFATEGPNMFVRLDVTELEAPQLISANPGFGPTAGGYSVELIGRGFLPTGTTVTVGGADCTAVTVTAPAQLTCTVPAAQAEGTVDIVVTTPAGQSAPAPFDYRDPLPTVNLAPPPSPVSGGDNVHLHADIGPPAADQISWVQTAGPQVTLSGADTGNPSFVAPVVSSRQTLEFKLSVDLGPKTSTQTLSLGVQPSGLTVDAGKDQFVNEGATVTLHARAPSVPAVTYAWTQVSGANVTLTGANTANPSFTANVPYQSPSPGSLGSFDGDLLFRVTITEPGTGRTTYEEVTVFVQPPLLAATGTTPLSVKAGLDQVVNALEDVALHAVASGGTTSAPGAAGYTYNWAQTNTGIGPTATLNNPDTANPDFTPTDAGRYVFEVTVTDDNGDTTDSVVIDVDVNLRVNLGRSAGIPAGAKVSLHPVVTGGTGNFSYQWATDKTITYITGSATDPNPVVTYNPAKTEAVTFTLKVTDNGPSPAVSASGSKTITFSVPIPVNSVDAGDDKTVKSGDQVSLHALADPDRGVAYQWQQAQGPTGIALIDANTTNALFTAPTTAGDYAFTVTASTKVNSVTDTVTITVLPTRLTSVNAGVDKTVQAGDSVSLHAVAAPVTTGTTYQWQAPSGVMLSGDTTTNPTFTAPSTEGDYTFTVTASKLGDSFTDKVTISVQEPLTTNAGTDQIVNKGDDIYLHGAGAHGSGTYTYQWTVLSPTDSSSFSNPADANAQFNPAKAGEYQLQLEVTDSGTSVTVTDTVTIKVLVPPSSDAGTDKTVTIGDTIHLHGSGVHGSGSYTYLWSVVSPANAGGRFDDATSSNPIFFPSKAGVVYTLQLTVTDSGTNTPVTDTVDISVREILTVDAGQNQTVKPGDPVTLHAVANKPGASFAWSENSATGITINNANSDNADFTAPTTQQSYSFEVTASKPLATTVTDRVTITVQDPVITSAGQDKTVTKGHLVHLHGSASHGIGPYTYQWSSINPPGTVTFSNATLSNPSFTPNTAGSYKLDLQVTDSTPGTPQVVHSTVTITVLEALTVNAGPDQDVIAGTTNKPVRATVPLSPTHSGGIGPFTYAWTLPAGVSLENGTTVNDQDIDVSYLPTTTEDKTLTLAVTDTGDGTVVSDSIKLTFKVLPPCPSGQELELDLATNKLTDQCKSPLEDFKPGHCALAGKTSNPAPAGAIFTANKCGDTSKGQPPIAICEKLHIGRTPEACGSNELPFVRIVNEDWGARTWETGCMTLQQCQTNWLRNTGPNTDCATFGKDNIYTKAFECTICCVGDGCNETANSCLVEPGSGWNPIRP